MQRRGQHNPMHENPHLETVDILNAVGEQI